MNHFVRPLLALFLLGTLLMPLPSLGAQTDVTIRIRPHCEEGSATVPAPQSAVRDVGCREFPLYDAEHAITQGLTVGSILDLDLVIGNPSRQRLQSVQSWLEYDPAVLRGKEVRITDTFPLVAPGEQAFEEEDGIVKLGASNVSGGAKEPDILFARVTFEVIAKGESLDHAVKFHAFSLLGQEGKTKVLLIESGKTVNVFKTRPLDLLLFFGEGVPPTTLPPSGAIPPGTPPPVTQPPVTVPPGNQPPIIVPPPGGVVVPPVTDEQFARLQPQGLQVTTDSDKVYLRWQALADPRVAGYNLYYGTVSGQYIQRRTVSAQTTGITVRGLPLGKRYFFAVTAFNALEQESDYSFEVAVTVGDPRSSTSPLTIPPSPENGNDGGTLPGAIAPGKGVPGQTGMPLILVPSLLVLASFFAFFFRARAA